MAAKDRLESETEETRAKPEKQTERQHGRQGRKSKADDRGRHQPAQGKCQRQLWTSSHKRTEPTTKDVKKAGQLDDYGRKVDDLYL